jgi:hypothetical protein
MSRTTFIATALVVAAFIAAGAYFAIPYLSGLQGSPGRVVFRADFASPGVSRWRVPQGTDLKVVKVGDIDAPIGRLSSTVPLNRNSYEWETLGASVLIPSNVVAALNGREIEITVRARTSAQNPSEWIWTVFATQQAGNTGWHASALSRSVEPFRLKFKVPYVQEGYAKPFILVLNGDHDGLGRVAEVESVSIVLLDKP